MELPLELSIFIPIFLIAIFMFYTYKGYHNGFILELIISISLIICAIVGWLLSDIIKDVFLLVPKTAVSTGVVGIDQMALSVVNRMVWFIIIFIVFNILLRIMRTYIRKLNKIVLVGKLNQILGALLGFVKSLLYGIVLIVLISSPIFKNGKATLQKAYLLPIRNQIKEHVPIAKDMLSAFDKVDAFREDGSFDWEQIIE